MNQTEHRLQLLRQARNEKLASSDWTQLPDAQLTNEQKLAWANYRQQLRDFPANVVFIPNSRVTWPQEPTA
jgi:hypothetical protein